MKAFGQINWKGFGICFLSCFLFAACNKAKVSPEAAKQSRLDWNLKTLVSAYQDSGNTDSKWDEPATNALAEFTRARTGPVDSDEKWANIIATNCDVAVKAGCDDPMIRYLYARFSMSRTNSVKDVADAFCDAADAMQQSSYPSVRKFYATLRALQEVYRANRVGHQKQPTGPLAQNLVEDLTVSLGDKAMPSEEAYEACSQGLYELSGNQQWYEDCYNQIQKSLFANWSDNSISWLLKGQAEIEMAWFARGSGYADSVTDAGRKSFNQHLAESEKALNRAWKMNPADKRIPRQMITLELGQGEGRERMELWFNRAMALDTNYYDACSAKLNYLQPKWYGSIDDMLAFGRECVQNEKWGGRVPLILLDAHRSINLMYTNETDRLNYWTYSAVWNDIKSSFDRFFELNPDNISWYHNYAWYAYHAEDWDTLNEIIPKLGPINYDYFGGKDEFDKMVQFAKEHAKPAAVPQQ